MKENLLLGASQVFVRDNVPTKHNHWIQTALLGFLVIVGVLIRQGNGLLTLGILWGSGLLFEILWAKSQNITPFKDGTTALWLCLFQYLVPMDAPLLALVISVMLGLYLAKGAFGGLGKGWINPVALMFLLFMVLGGFETQGTFFDPWTDLQQSYRTSLEDGGGQPGGNSLALAIEGGYSENIRGISDFVNNWFLGPLRIKIPTGYYHLAFSSRSATMGQLLGFWLFLVSIWFLARDLHSKPVVFGFILAYLPLAFVLGDLPFSGEWFKGDVFFHLFAGNFAISVFFIAPLMGSLPLTKRGHFYYGLLTGGLSFVTRLFLLPGDTLPLGILLAGFAIPVYNFLSRNARKLREKRL
jgi:Na+-translocating ferredoxin:NAD+ oxidoreductase RnfD subunit